MKHPAYFACRSLKQCWSKPTESVPSKEKKPSSTWRNRWRSKPALNSRVMLCPLLVASLANCGTIPPTHSSGRYVTTQHGTARFGDAYQGAKEYCAKLGMELRHLGTDISGQALSRFECVESK